MAKARIVTGVAGWLLIASMAASSNVFLDAHPAEARSKARHGASPAKAAPEPSSPALSSLPPPEPFPKDAAAKTGLTIGNLQATLTASDPSVVLAVGSSGFVTVAITDAGGNRTATVLAESESGEVRAITGKGIRASKVRGGLAAEIPLLKAGTTSVSIELVLKGGARGQDGKTRDRVRVTLLPQKGGRDESIYGWQLSDCAGDYYAELQKIMLDKRPRMLGTLDAVIETDPLIPAAWIFPPAKIAAAPVCKSKKGKKSSGCEAASQTAVAKDEGQILAIANQVLHDKGALAAYQRKRDPLRQVSFTLLNGLRNYMEQAAHPALCSGVASMVDYYTVHTPLLRSTIADARQVRVTAEALAASKIAELVRIAPSSASSQPQTSGTGLGLVTVAAAAEGPAVAGSHAATQVDLVGKSILRPADLAMVAGDKDAIAKLQRLRGLFDGEATAGLSPGQRSAAIAALGMIEAGLYLDAAAQKYNRIDETIYGTMSAIKDAHDKTCVCTQ